VISTQNTKSSQDLRILLLGPMRVQALELAQVGILAQVAVQAQVGILAQVAVQAQVEILA
jgi:hypothetical protein